MIFFPHIQLFKSKHTSPLLPWTLAPRLDPPSSMPFDFRPAGLESFGEFLVFGKAAERPRTTSAHRSNSLEVLLDPANVTLQIVCLQALHRRRMIGCLTAGFKDLDAAICTL